MIQFVFLKYLIEKEPPVNKTQQVAINNIEMMILNQIAAVHIHNTKQLKWEQMDWKTLGKWAREQVWCIDRFQDLAMVSKGINLKRISWVWKKNGTKQMIVSKFEDSYTISPNLKTLR